MQQSPANQDAEDGERVIFEIPGYGLREIETRHLPPVGTRMQIHKHLTDGGTYLTLLVTAHEYILNDAAELHGPIYFSIYVRTRIVPPEPPLLHGLGQLEQPPLRGQR